jgi:hypothetical protein
MMPTGAGATAFHSSPTSRSTRVPPRFESVTDTTRVVGELIADPRSVSVVAEEDGGGGGQHPPRHAVDEVQRAPADRGPRKAVARSGCRADVSLSWATARAVVRQGSDWCEPAPLAYAVEAGEPIVSGV